MASIRAIAQGSVTEAIVGEVLKEMVANNARDVALYYQDLGLREANLRMVEMGSLSLLDIHVGSFSADSHFVDRSTTWRQLNLDIDRIGDPSSHPLGTVRSSIAHELFHACFNGYDLNMGPSNRYALGFNEGLAALMGHTNDTGIITVRQDTPHLLGSSIGDADVTCSNTSCSFTEGQAYTSNDWFAYIGRRFDSDSLVYVGGHGTDTTEASNGLLEQLRVLNRAQTPSNPDEALLQLRNAMHASFEAQFNLPLSEIYWDFVRNRAYEHNDDSRLRTADAAMERYTLDTSLFDVAL